MSTDPSSAKNVLAIGHSCADLVLRAAHAPGADEKVEAQDHWFGGGGPAANAAVLLRRFGHQVRLLTAIGDDRLGRVVHDELAGEGVELLAPRLGGTTSVAQILSTGSERSVVWRRGDLAPLEVPTASKVDAWLHDVDLLYLDGHEGEVASAFAAVAVERGIPLVVDFGTLREHSTTWLEQAAWAMTTPGFAVAFGAPNEARRALDHLHERRGKDRIGITLGARGSIAKIGNAMTHIPPRKVRVVDSTGAGDAFHAGLADAVLSGLDGVEALEWATILGGAVCRFPGGRRGLPADRAEVLRWSERWPARPLSFDLDSASLLD